MSLLISTPFAASYINKYDSPTTDVKPISTFISYIYLDSELVCCFPFNFEVTQ